MYSDYFFTLTTMQKDSDRQFQARQNAGRIDMVILLSISLGCCAEFVDVAKQIMKAVSLSSTQQVAL